VKANLFLFSVLSSTLAVINFTAPSGALAYFGATDVTERIYVDSATVSVAAIKPGDSFKITAQVHTDVPTDFTGCGIDLKSPERRIPVALTTCKITSIDSEHFVVEATKTFDARSFGPWGNGPDKESFSEWTVWAQDHSGVIAESFYQDIHVAYLPADGGYAGEPYATFGFPTTPSAQIHFGELFQINVSTYLPSGGHLMRATITSTFAKSQYIGYVSHLDVASHRADGLIVSYTETPSTTQPSSVITFTLRVPKEFQSSGTPSFWIDYVDLQFDNLTETGTNRLYFTPVTLVPAVTESATETEAVLP